MSITLTHSDGRENSFESYMDARRQFQTWQYEAKTSKLGVVTLLIGEDVKDRFDAAASDLISPTGKTASVSSSKKRRVKRNSVPASAKKVKKASKKAAPKKDKPAPKVVSKEEWEQRGKKVTNIGEHLPDWCDQLDALAAMDEDQLTAGKEGMSDALADAGKDADNKEALSFMVEYTTYCIAQKQYEKQHSQPVQDENNDADNSDSAKPKSPKKKQIAMLNGEKVKSKASGYQIFVGTFEWAVVMRGLSLFSDARILFDLPQLQRGPRSRTSSRKLSRISSSLRS
jgi:hypothetical protein